MPMAERASNKRMQSCRLWLVRQLRTLPRLWRDTVARPVAAAEGLDIALRPSPLARRAASLLLAAQLLHAAELLWLGHLLVAGLVLAVAAALLIGWRVTARVDGNAPRRLLLLADGRLCLMLAGGAVEPVTLLPASLRLGSWLLLVLRGAACTHRLLLGPDNLDAASRACLHRRLRAARGEGVPGFMVAAPGAAPGRR